MLINNFGSLKAELARYMFTERFASDYDTAVQNFEAAANRRLRTKWQERLQNITTNYGIGDVPFDYSTWRTVLWKKQSPFVELDYVHPAYFRTSPEFNADSSGSPLVFTIENQTFMTAPQDNTTAAFEFHYYSKILTITDGPNGSNWLILRWPDVYLFGALAELFALGRNRESAELYKARRDEVLLEIMLHSSRETGATSARVREGQYF